MAITPELRQKVKETAASIRSMLNSAKLPPPVNDARCKECSLKEICQPEAVSAHDAQHEMINSLFDVES